MGKNPPAFAGDSRDVVQSQGLEDPLRRAWIPTPVFLPGKLYGKWRLAGYSPWGCQELDMTEHMDNKKYI